MTVSLPGVVELVGICNLGKERTRVFGQWMEEDSIYDQSNGLA